MTVFYIDMASGISGDMFISSFLDLGFPIAHLKKRLKLLQLEDFNILSGEKKQFGITARTFSVISKINRKYLSFKEIKKIIGSSKLSQDEKENSLKILGILGEAEAKVHSQKLNEVHFHEIGALDSIVDIISAAVILSYYKGAEFYSSKVVLGRGKIMTEHGELPLPAPATCEIIKGMPIAMRGEEFEFTTPTGAAIIKGIHPKFSFPADFVMKNIGYGAGTRKLKSKVSFLRIFEGEKATNVDDIVVCETNIDDMPSEWYEEVYEKLFSAGAVDVFLTPIIMKKSRPAIKLTVIAQAEKIENIEKIIFENTTTFGIRKYAVSRAILERKIQKVKTEYGTFSVKIGMYKGEKISVSPEYDELKRAAKRWKKPIKFFHSLIMKKL